MPINHVLRFAKTRWMMGKNSSVTSESPHSAMLAMAHLDGAGDQNFVVHASAFAACAAADPGFVHFDVFVRATPDAILVRADHSGAKLMEDLEGCLIAR